MCISTTLDKAANVIVDRVHPSTYCACFHNILSLEFSPVQLLLFGFDVLDCINSDIKPFYWLEWMMWRHKAAHTISSF